MIELAGRRVLVTGGDRGIGGACSRYFARAGAAVLVHYRAREEEARRTLAELRTVSGEPHLAFAADLASPASIGELFAFLSAEWGRLDCLVNNAGIWVENPVAELDEDLFQATWKVNVQGPFVCAREAVALLRASGHGCIVNIASTAGQRGEAFHSPYAASKGAMIAATKSWATELAPEVRVNCVAPGWVDTEMCAAAFAGGGKARIAAGIPLGGVASPEEIAGPVLFLASDLARHVTGEILNVNGGSVLAG